MLVYLKNLLWGSFSVAHITSLILGAAIIVSLYFILKNKSEKTKTVVLGILSLSGIGAIIFNLVMWNSPIEYLPFHLCSFTALILPFVVFSKSNVWGNLVVLWSLGALLAILLNQGQANFKIFSWTFVFFFFPHLLEFGIPIILILFKRIKIAPRYIISTTVLTFVIYTIIHFINIFLNNYVVQNNITDSQGNLVFLNYMYSIEPPVNPALELFYSILPKSYWYMFVSLPIIALYLTLLNIPYFIKRRKAKKASQIKKDLL